MRCPRCSNDGFSPYAVCAKCGFAGAPGQVEELSHVAYLLGELETWRELPEAALARLRARYLNRRQQLEVELGLRLLPLTQAQARNLQWEVYCLTELQEEVEYWVEQGWVRVDPAGRLRQGAKKRAEVLCERLKDAPPAPAFGSPRDGLKLLDYLEQMLDQAHRRGHFVDDQARAAALADLQADRHDLEVEAGLRTQPPKPVPIAAAKSAPAPAVPPPSGRREPLTWDRIWQTLLSQRTLNVLLFLGAFLLVASATTYVVYNWERLPPAVQLGFIVLFTLSFYGAGWFLRVRMGLRASGIAITAVGSLLVPLDFYAIFVAGAVLPESAWPWVWLMAATVCLPIYTFTALRLRAEFFGYLVAIAAGSLVCAGLRVVGAPDEWWLAGLLATALVLVALAYRIKAALPWTVLSRPLRFSSLVATSVILPLGIGWWLASGASGFSFDASLAGAWILGAMLYAYAAAREQSPLLGRAAATALPIGLILLLRLAFVPLEIEAPWYALGWAVLAPIYLWAGYRAFVLSEPGRLGAGQHDSGTPAAPIQEAKVLRAHSHTATGWGLAMLAVAAVWAIFDLWAAAATHAVLVAGVALAAFLWRRPRALPVASLLALSSTTFAMAAGHLEPAELCLGWALLAVLHILAALRLRRAPEYAARLFAAAPAAASLAILPPAILHHEPLLTHALGHWIALALWLHWLEHTGEHAGLDAFLNRLGPLRWSALHWAVALPLPFLATMLYTRFRPVDGWLGFLLAVLGWSCFALGRWMLDIGNWGLETGRWSLVIRRASFPWYAVGYGCSVAAPVLALYLHDQPLLGVTVLLAAGLYLASAWAFRHDVWLIPGGLALPLGLLILLDYWAVPWPQQSVMLAAVAAIYLLGGTWLVRRRGVPADFMASLDAVAHLVAVAALFWGLEPAAEHLIGDLPWPDPARLWAAAGQVILGVTYGLIAWFHSRERWAHIAAWLGVLAGGLIATAYSQGRGSSAFKAALLAVAYVLAERALTSHWLRRRWLGAKRAWTLYRRALLIAGWCVSAGAIGLALLRNLWLLGGGFTREVWAIASLLTITALYALSAWIYRRRVFVWLAGALAIAPWTLLTLWGWFLWTAPPPLPRYALSWAALACAELGAGLLLTGPLRSPPQAGETGREQYGFPLRVIANVLLPFALFWAVADAATSSITWGLGLVFYLASAVADHRRGLGGWSAARFLYPTVAAGPVWAVYLLNHFVPTAPHETYGLLLLAFPLPLLAIGRWARRVDVGDGLPLYLGAYGAAIAGTMLVAHRPPLLAAALTFDALLCILSARLFREPLWGYPAAALAPAAMLVALAESQMVPPERHGWWLIGLGTVYLALAWLLRRARLREYAIAPLAATFTVVALGLPPSSLDDTGAFWGYLAAAGVYAAAAAWLRQPLLLTPTAALLAVPYGVALVWLNVSPADYGLALFPGVVATLALAHLLDSLLPVGRDSSHTSSRWVAITRLLDWWAAPLYAWGYAGALVAIGLSLRPGSGHGRVDSVRLAMVLALAAATYLHATWRFRLRAYLLLAAALAQGAALAIIDAAGWLAYPSWAALAFLPVTAVTAAAGLAIELRRQEGSPLSARWFAGWSRPFYLLLVADLLAGQAVALLHSEPGALATAVHALILAVLATVWAQPVLPYVAAGAGVAGLFQGLAWAGAETTGYPIGLALLALGYGLLGYAIHATWHNVQRARIWFKPLEWSAWGLSATALLWALGAGLGMAGLVVRTLLGRAVTFADYASQVRMWMWVLAITGLIYLSTAIVRKWYALGYGSVGLLLGAWALWWRFFVDMPSFQWYAVPAGLYLLGIGWPEWRHGHQALARWIDRAGMLAWLGTAWWQSLPGVMADGWPYALIMGAEALLLVWLGSARRMKRFLYAGAVAVALDAVTQSIEPLLSANRWIVFGIAGGLLVGLAILVERKLEAIRELSAEMRMRLEGWE